MVKIVAKMLMGTLLAAAMVGGFMDVALAQSVGAKLDVRATVLPTLSLRIVRQPSRLEISRSDIRRGYVDIRPGTILVVSTNSPQGYLLSITASRLQAIGGGNTVTDVFSSVILSVNGNTYQIAPYGSVDVSIIPRSTRSETQRMNYRFLLAPTAKKGKYPWPIHLTATPM